MNFEGCDFEEVPDEIMEAPSSELFPTKRLKMPSRPDGSVLYGILGIDFLSTSGLLNPYMKFCQRLIRARLNFYMISDNPNVSLGIVDCCFTLVVLLSGLIITGEEKTCLHILPWSTTTWKLWPRRL